MHKKAKARARPAEDLFRAKQGVREEPQRIKSIRKGITRILTRLKRKQYERGEDGEYRQVLKKNNERQ